MAGRDGADSSSYSALILNFGYWRDTAACAESLLASQVPPERIVICDNGSPDGSLEKLACWAVSSGVSLLNLNRDQALAWKREMPLPEGVILVANKANMGYAAGNNTGLTLLMRGGAGYIWILNNDTLVAPEAADALLRHMHEHGRCGLLGTLTRYLDNPEAIQCLGGGWYSPWWGLSGLYGEGIALPQGQRPPQLQGPLDYVNGASVFVRRELLEQVGLMSEDYFLYCEELDWALRARGRFELGFEPQAEVLHREGLSTGVSHRRGLRRSLRMSLTLLRSRLLLTYKFYPLALPTVLLGQVFALGRKALGRVRAMSLRGRAVD